jgi:hypothetical protein
VRILRSLRLLALLSTWAGREPERFWRRSLVAITRPPKSFVKTVGFRMARVSDPSGQFGGPGGHSHHRRVIDARDAGNERKAC